MANQYKNKVVYGGDTLIDLTEDTVTTDTLLSGTTAHDKSGAPIRGTYTAPVTSVNGQTGDVTVVEGLEPLIGTTETVTPQQVMTALSEGRDICVSASTSFGTTPLELKFTAWNRATDTAYSGAAIDVVVSQTIALFDSAWLIFELIGGTNEGTPLAWTINRNILATETDIISLENRVVSSVNGQTGTVELSIPSTASDVGALPDTTLYAGASAAGGPATVANGIHYAAVDSTSTATVFTATSPGITEYYDGLTIMLRNGVITSASGFTVNINNLGAKPVYSSMATATRETTIFNVNYTLLLVYDSTRVTGGCWVNYRGYYSDSNTVPTGYCTTAAATAAKSVTCTYGYRDDDNYFPCVFRYANTAANATLAIASYATTAAPIYVNGARTSSTNTFGRGVILFLYHNGGYYCYNDGRFPIVVNGTVTSLQDYVASKSLPDVTTSDNGKFLQVVNGSWAAASIPNASGVSF